MTEMNTKAIPDHGTTAGKDGKSNAESLPAALRRPVVPSLTRMLAGRPMEEEILDPANPNLMVDRDELPGRGAGA